MGQSRWEVPINWREVVEGFRERLVEVLETDHVEKPTTHAAWFDGPGDTGGKLTSVLLSTNHQTIGAHGAVLLCQQFK